VNPLPPRRAAGGIPPAKFLRTAPKFGAGADRTTPAFGRTGVPLRFGAPIPRGSCAGAVRTMPGTRAARAAPGLGAAGPWSPREGANRPAPGLFRKGSPTIRPCAPRPVNPGPVTVAPRPIGAFRPRGGAAERFAAFNAGRATLRRTCEPRPALKFGAPPTATGPAGRFPAGIVRNGLANGAEAGGAATPRLPVRASKGLVGVLPAPGDRGAVTTGLGRAPGDRAGTGRSPRPSRLVPPRAGGGRWTTVGIEPHRRPAPGQNGL